MPQAEIGRWEFFIPDGWSAQDQGIGVSYFEAPDGTRGLYAKTIRSTPPEPSARVMDEYVQRTHHDGFAANEDNSWAVMARSSFNEGDLVRSRLDLWDESSGYRVLSLVLCSASEAIQVTLHDYACIKYGEARDPFSEVEESIRLAAGAA